MVERRACLKSIKLQRYLVEVSEKYPACHSEPPKAVKNLSRIYPSSFFFSSERKIAHTVAGLLNYNNNAPFKGLGRIT